MKKIDIYQLHKQCEKCKYLTECWTDYETGVYYSSSMQKHKDCEVARMIMSKKVNLGCGKDIKEGWENYDMHPEDSRVKYLDMNSIPYPFDENSIDVILASHVLEHLYIPIYEAMKELHRILKPGGKLIVALPINSNIVEHQKCRFNIFYFNSIVDNPVGAFAIRERYGQKKPMFHIEKVEIVRNFQKILFKKGAGGGWSEKITGYNWINLFKYAPHRIWDMLFNGEIIWEMTAIKGDENEES